MRITSHLGEVISAATITLLMSASDAARAVDIGGKNLEYSFRYARCSVDPRSIRRIDNRTGMTDASRIYFSSGGNAYLFFDRGKDGVVAKMNAGITHSTKPISYKYKNIGSYTATVPVDAEVAWKDNKLRFHFNYTHSQSEDAVDVGQDVELLFHIGDENSCSVTDSTAKSYLTFGRKVSYKYECTGVVDAKCTIYSGEPGAAP